MNLYERICSSKDIDIFRGFRFITNVTIVEKNVQWDFSPFFKHLPNIFRFTLALLQLSISYRLAVKVRHTLYCHSDAFLS